MVRKRKKKKQGIQRVIVKSQLFIIDKPASFEEPVSKNKYRYRFALRCFQYVDAQLQVGQAAARGQRRKAVIRDLSGVDHRRVTNLSASIWFTGERHCTVFRHVMQLSLLVLC